MDSDTEDKIDALCLRGNEQIDEGNYLKAVSIFEQALQLVPEPKFEYEATGWLYVAIGDAYYFQGDHEKSLDCFHHAYRIYGVENLNPFILLRLGQCNFHLGNEKEAVDFLLRAYMLEGEDIFEDDPSFLEYLKKHVNLES